MSFQHSKTNKLNPEPSQPLNFIEAKKKLMDFVARRDHTEKELRTKLAASTTDEIVEQAITWARQQNWLPTEEKLKTHLAEQLSKRGKGILTINQKLKDLGLEDVKANEDSEYEKAKKLVLAKWAVSDFKDLGLKESQKLQAKIMRYLIARGYESDTVSKILSIEFKKSSNYGDEIYDEEF